jgi:dihydrofolate reductase
MGKLVVVNHMTLDGVMQAPARADEDIRGGFAHGGWATANNDEVMAATLGRRMAEGGSGRGGLLLGRRTYEDFYAVWPSRTGDPVSDLLNRTPKYVVSRTLTEPLPWSNSFLIDGDPTEAVAGLKQALAGLTILGSGELIATLMAADLIDEYLLLIHPLVFGTGRRLFPEGVHASLRLSDSVITTKGVMIATYEPVR